MDVTRTAGPAADLREPAPWEADVAAPDLAKLRDRLAVLLILLVSTWVVLPRLIQSVTAPKYLASVGEEAPPLSGIAALATRGLTLALLGYCVLSICLVVKQRHPGRVGALSALLAPWLYLSLRDMYVGHHPDKPSLMYPLVVITLWLLRPRIEVLRYIGYVVGVSAVASMVLALVLPDKGILHSSVGELVTEGKSIVPQLVAIVDLAGLNIHLSGTQGGILIGFLTHGNNLGQFLALGLPFVAMVPRRWLRWLLLVVTSVALLWTAARGQIAAPVIGGLVVLVLLMVPMEARRRVGPVLALSPYLLVGVLPFITHDPHDFTNRGLIWMKSIEWWHRNPFFGLGSDWYARVGATGDRLASSVFNGHNQLIHLLVTGGLVLVILVAVQLVVAAWRSGVLAASGHNVGVAYLATLAATGILEKSLVIVDNTSMFPVVVLPLAILMCGDYTPRLQKRRAETDELTPGPLEYEGAGTR